MAFVIPSYLIESVKLNPGASLAARRWWLYGNHDNNSHQGDFLPDSLPGKERQPTWLTAQLSIPYVGCRSG